LEATGNTLTIRGERPAPTVSNESSYHRRERDFGSFRRSMTLPEQVESGKVVATYNDGILEIRLPFAEAAKRRKIAVTNA
jgi:HSP20 family protein